MKRTVEIVLSVIGILFYGLVAALGGLMIFLQNSEEALQEIVAGDREMGWSSLETLSEGMGTGGWLIIIASMIAIILGVIAIALIRGNKRPKISGAIYIAVSIIGSIVTVGFGIIPGVFYLIAGIMSFARKPIQPI